MVQEGLESLSKAVGNPALENAVNAQGMNYQGTAQVQKHEDRIREISFVENWGQVH